MADLKEELKEIKELLIEDKKQKEKKFKFPFSSRVRTSKAKKNYITVMKINENCNVTFKKVQIKEQTFMEDGIPRLAGAGYILYYKKNPMVILPSWSVEPFSSLKSFQESLTDGTNAKGYALLMNRMKSVTIDAKKQMGGMVKWIIGIGLAVIIGYALITGGG